ncbi:UbiA family prenyltransferase [Heliobacterium chlorum]|uniref:UbiA family prenyltransferase n=1 Tax=Heliobacterium chlorum TaxID=2698 RepID=A0ABR7T275_HELCL|nr:UbiA family prenyltransferase [Heliobacterium chlorum]MBC9784756.1 UbiA family prenyltransferase [Heliobacterium chlorum]
MNIVEFWNIARPSACFRYAITVVIAAIIERAPSYSLPPLFLAGFFFVAGIYTLDDIEDVEEDRINHPERPLPSGKLSLSSARSFGYSCLLLSVLLTAIMDSWTALFILVISFASAHPRLHRLSQCHWLGRGLSIFVFIVSSFYMGAAGSTGPISRRLFLLAVAIGVLHLATRVIGDERDLEGDRGRLRTLPKAHPAHFRYFIRYTLMLSAFLLPLPFFFGFTALYLVFSLPVAFRILFHGRTWRVDNAGTRPSHLLAAVVFVGALLSR